MIVGDGDGVGVFNEMEMKINIINNKIFTELYLKIRVRGK